MAAIYRILNTQTDSCYIGQTTDYKRRKREHLNELRNNRHSNDYLQNAFNKYGEQSFVFEQIEECSREQLNSREEYWLSIYGGCNSPKNYNLSPAGGCAGASKATLLKLKGRKVSDETKQKMSQSRKGKKLNLSDEQRKAIGERTRNNLSGKPRTEEYKKRLSEKLKTKASESSSWGMTGKHHTQETKNKISKTEKLTKNKRR